MALCYRKGYVVINSVVALLCLSLFSISDTLCQEAETESMKEGAINVYPDLSPRDLDYIKREIPYVNYVRDRKQAQVHVMMMTQRTGSGGIEHTITFTGLQDCSALCDTLIYTSQQMDSDDTVREGIVQALKLGLMRYVNRTPYAGNLVISYNETSRTNPGNSSVAAVHDKWNYWVFNIDTNNRVNGEESRSNFSFRGSVSADRVTPNWKMSFDLGGDYNRRMVKVDDDEIVSETRSQDFRALVVKSLSDHWSAGFFGEQEQSNFSNIDMSFEIAPAIEFDVFPYSESTYREFCFLYRLGYIDTKYVEETLFSKTHDKLYNQSLLARYEIKERWGSVTASLEGSHYFHDFEKNRLDFDTNISVRMFEGLSLTLFGSISRIHDQLSLPKSDATDEEILLNQRELATGYDYSISVGLRYTFGSIYSNVVNPRFNTGGPGGGFGGPGGFR